MFHWMITCLYECSCECYNYHSQKDEEIVYMASIDFIHISNIIY